MKVAQQAERGFVGPKVESSNLFFHPSLLTLHFILSGGGEAEQAGL